MRHKGPHLIAHDAPKGIPSCSKIDSNKKTNVIMVQCGRVSPHLVLMNTEREKRAQFASATRWWHTARVRRRVGA